MIFIGTSGFYYKDWIGTFYPKDIKQKDLLYFYSKTFNALEVNSSFYRILTKSTTERFVRIVPRDFKFTFKIPKTITHEFKFNNKDIFDFQKSLEPVIEENKLGGILAQFPYSFHNNPKNIKILMKIIEIFNNIKIIVEFRNKGWLDEEILNILRDTNTGFCNVDEPEIPNLMPKTSITTTDIGYIRFHGRRKEKWFKHESAVERYDYEYKEHELREWIPKIKEINEKVNELYIFANNHFMGKAAITAKTLMKLIKESLGIKCEEAGTKSSQMELGL